MHIQGILDRLSFRGQTALGRSADPSLRFAPLHFACPWKQGLSAREVDLRSSVAGRVHVFANGHLDETCKIVNPVLQGADGSATRSAGQGARDVADGSLVLPGASRSQPPGKTGIALSKPRGETMIEIRAGMRSCRSAMLQPCRPASCKGHPRILLGLASNPTTSAGVA